MKQYTRTIQGALCSVIQAQSLLGLAPDNIVGQWIDRVYTDTDPLPRCVISPDPNPPDPPTRNLSKVTRFFNYGIVFLAKLDQEKPRRNGGDPIDWRDTVMDHFLEGALLPTVPEVDLITLLPGPPISNSAFDMAGLMWSSFNLKVRHRTNLS